MSQWSAPEYYQAPDPRDPRADQGRPWWLWGLVLGLVVLASWVQHRDGSATGKLAGGGSGGGQAASTLKVPEPPGMLGVLGKIMVAGRKDLGSFRDQALRELQMVAQGPVDQLRVAIVLDELELPEAANDALMNARLVLHKTPYEDDVETYRRVRSEGEAPLSDSEKQALIDRHGWFGELVATRPLPETDARRAAVLDAGVGVLAVLLVVGLGMGTGFLIGIGLLIVGLVFYLQGRMKIGRPLPTFQRGVALEMVAIFLLLFIGMKFVGEALASSGGLGRWSLPALLGLQWCLALVIFWPRLRGASSGEMREALGLHRGRGVLNEIGCGIMGYLAGLPIMIASLVVAVGLTFIVEFVRRMREAARQGIDPSQVPSAPFQGPDPTSNPIMQAMGSGDTLTLILLASLVVIWAPLVEETIFRGAMFAELRRWARWPFAAALTAVCFAVVHPYPLLLMVPVAVLGFNFCVLRAWRGSLIAPMTAHFLQNAVALSIMAVLGSQM
jgi:membrane protease YdiL (CAAX protease family)